ncbi:MAG: bifunctional phosphoglucose/phosphomannose isomerase [Candidatus Colwellbacteria bacterium CG10_big_fil_rev_8_21_14_0_10_41_28]|uniref:Bifunctional phosphoglucose/phosphomannose isomerase n=1 Tax=Candidatus Colwellbacteria bacterium CG10_big_fil_rev_8_21_14_0_10_41_28 TaxID=1974539 RepID=A0A2H0VHG2_9BACT|nr:MAG: bifunctional phosphoglucose/phosphomannose isomerase [Candidatus Colwellbacteria bacterium CG10_big_fil_rev_8_21_14_0_10_41_28]
MKDKMREAIESFQEQFRYEPKISNLVGSLAKFDKFAIFGMGGSGLIGDALNFLKPELDLLTHKGYGLPKIDLSGRLLIFISYSGNTEEVLDAFEKALEKGHHIAVISTGGELIKRAKKVGALYIEIPKTGIQPRMATGYMILAALEFFSEGSLKKELSSAAARLKNIESGGELMAKNLIGKVPVIYSSRENSALAYNWKTKFNETGKIPAFFNTFSELNHNEISGFDSISTTKDLTSKFAFIFIKDKEDHPRVTKRMKVLEDMYKKRDLLTLTVNLEGKNRSEKLINAISLIDWSAYHLAKLYIVESNEVPLIEEFKKKL